MFDLNKVSKFYKHSPTLGVCHSLYNNSIKSGLFSNTDKIGLTIIGKGLLYNEQARDVVKNFGVLDSESNGSLIAPKPWSLLANDIIMMALVHSLHDFMIFNPKQSECEKQQQLEVKYNNIKLLIYNEDLLSITAREIAILMLSGYEPLKNDNLGIVLINVDSKKASALTLLKINKYMKQISGEEIVTFLLKNHNTSLVENET